VSLRCSRLRTLGRGPKDNEELAKMLHGGCAELVADTSEHRIALGARVNACANLDQFMRVEADVDFVQHRGRQSMHADADDRMQVMRFRAKPSAFAG